jgi:hypothetical protein
MWYNILTTNYTTNHNPLVVYKHLTTTSGLWFSIYSIIHTLFNHYNEESKKYWENQIWWQFMSTNLCWMQQLLIVAELKLFKYFLIYVTFHVLCLYFLLYHQRAFPVHLSTGSICVFTIIRLILLKISAYWKKHNHRHAKKAMIWKCSNVKHNFIQHIKCFISTFKSSGGFHIKII